MVAGQEPGMEEEQGHEEAGRDEVLTFCFQVGSSLFCCAYRVEENKCLKTIETFRFTKNFNNEDKLTNRPGSRDAIASKNGRCDFSSLLDYEFVWCYSLYPVAAVDMTGHDRCMDGGVTLQLQRNYKYRHDLLLRLACQCAVLSGLYTKCQYF